jgi:hypothetical protein
MSVGVHAVVILGAVVAARWLPWRVRRTARFALVTILLIAPGAFVEGYATVVRSRVESATRRAAALPSVAIVKAIEIVVDASGVDDVPTSPTTTMP